MDKAGCSDQRIPLTPRIRYVQTRALLSDRKIDRQNLTVELFQDLTVKPPSQDCPLRRVAALGQERPEFKFHRGNGRDVDRRRSNRGGPPHHVGVGPARSNLAKFRYDIGIEKEHQRRSGGVRTILARGGSNSTSSSMASASTRLRPLPASRRYSSIDSNTWAGRPRSVMKTGPASAAFLSPAGILVEFPAGESRDGHESLHECIYVYTFLNWRLQD